MEKIIRYINNNSKPVIIAGFCIWLICGLGIYSDFGMGWDEEYSRTLTGKVVYDFVAKGDKQAYLANTEKYHGPLWELLLYTAERVSNIHDTQKIFFLRHLLNFLLFSLALFIFFKLCNAMLHNAWLALLACAMLALSPRIFGDVFYNTKDIAFMSFYIFAAYTFFNSLNSKTYIAIVIHGILTALCIDVRITAIIIPVITIFTWAVHHYLRSERWWSLLLINQVLVYLAVVIVVVIVAWPILWLNPIKHFALAYWQMSHYHWNEKVLFMGELINGQQLPRYYPLIWIAISTPLVYILAAILGIMVWCKQPIKNSKDSDEFGMAAVAVFFMLPLGAVVILHAVIYDGWRHLYFIYPGLVLLSVWVVTYFNKHNKALTAQVISAALIVQCMYNVYFLYRNHPHSMVYFNSWAGANAGVLRWQYEQDYWGVSYRKGLEYIAANDTRDSIAIRVANYPGVSNLLMLPPTDRQRMYVDEACTTPDYYITNFRYQLQENLKGDEVYAVYADESKILSVQKLK